MVNVHLSCEVYTVLMMILIDIVQKRLIRTLLSHYIHT